MAGWNPNNRACTTTWTTLRVMGQISTDITFNNAGEINMSKLEFWIEGASSEIRQMQAKSLAITMDNIFRMIRGAKYEEGVSNEKAISDIVNFLTTAENTIAGLAENNDSNYYFWREREDA